jgi:UDP-glucose 4-epimerase
LEEDVGSWEEFMKGVIRDGGGTVSPFSASVNASLSSFFSGKSVWVTGGLGFIGTALCEALVQLGAHVTAIDSLQPGCGGRKSHAAELGERITWVQADIGEIARWGARALSPDLVFNLAAHISHIGSERDPELDLELNTRSQLRFLRGLSSLRPGVRVIYSSTRQIYGETSEPVDESARAHPPDWNGVHKLAAEEYHLLQHRRRAIDAVALRLPNVYGPRMPVDVRGKGCFVGWFARGAFRGETLELLDGGRAERDLLFVTDAVAALLNAAGEIPTGRIWNVSGEKATIAQVAHRLVALAGRGQCQEVELQGAERQVKMGTSLMNGAAFRAATPWAPRVTLDEGLQALLVYLQKHPEAFEEERR